MGLLDSVLGQVLGGAAQPPQGGATGGLGALGDMGPLAGMLGGLLANNSALGGLGGLVEKFGQAGLGDTVSSWIGKGDNVPVSGEQVQGALGNDVIAGLASKLGLSAATLLPMLATMLPMLIDKLTPDGKVPEQGVAPPSNDLLASLSNLLQK